MQVNILKTDKVYTLCFFCFIILGSYINTAAFYTLEVDLTSKVKALNCRLIAKGL